MFVPNNVGKIKITVFHRSVKYFLIKSYVWGKKSGPCSVREPPRAGGEDQMAALSTIEVLSKGREAQASPPKRGAEGVRGGFKNAEESRTGKIGRLLDISSSHCAILLN